MNLTELVKIASSETFSDAIDVRKSGVSKKNFVYYLKELEFRHIIERT